jgi:2,4-dienoyl-CoA reductase (NADPH2)
VLFGPHETNLGDGRRFSARHAAYYGRRAAGGAGVVVTEVASVHDSDWPYERAPLAAHGWGAVLAACRPHGALVLAGLGHAGGQGSSAYHHQALWAPSRVPDAVTREVPMAVEQPEIDALVAAFGAAATLAAAADLDGVEVDAGQHSILRQFLSGLTNHRTDGYGADRVRLLREVLDAVRTGLGDDRVLGLRLCCDELAPWAGITPAAGADTAAGWPTRWTTWCRSAAARSRSARPAPTCTSSRGSTRAPARRCAAPRALPTVLQGSVVDPTAARVALDAGTADLVEMTAPSISDPDLVAHVRAGRHERVRPCTLSNQRTACATRAYPLVSDEAERAPGHGSTTTGRPRSIPGHVRRWSSVVGPAGLEAARTLALRGHWVRLVERAPVLGGALRWAAACTGAPGWACWSRGGPPSCAGSGCGWSWAPRSRRPTWTRPRGPGSPSCWPPGRGRHRRRSGRTGRSWPRGSSRPPS